MIRLLKIHLLMTWLFLAFNPVQAQQNPQPNNSTGEILVLCKQPKNKEDLSYCNGFGQGVWDTYLITRHPTRSPGFVCMPGTGLPRDAILADFYDWIEQHPHYKDLPAADSVLRYMGTRFPCTKQ